MGIHYLPSRFHTVSSSNPRLLIGVEQGGEWSFFSSPQPQPSLVVAAKFHMKFSKDTSPSACSYSSGFIYFPYMRISKNDVVHVIYNPSTGQYAILPPPDITTNKKICGFLGFDPIGKQFKVLILKARVDDELVYQILTLGTENVTWREIICPCTYFVSSEHICINGVLYYKTGDPDHEGYYDKIGCFDVRSEKFKFVNLYSDMMIGCFDWPVELINYKGKLGLVGLEYANDDGGFPLELRMWVLEDVEKREWTTYAYTLRADNKVVKVNNNLDVVGVTASGETILVKDKAYKPFYVFYLNPERNTLRRVEIQGAREEEEWFKDHSVYYFVDHVENLSFDVMKTTYAATSIYKPTTT